MSTRIICLYESQWIPTWGPIGRRRVRKLARAGWEYVGSLRTGLLRRDHCLIRITEEGDRGATTTSRSPATSSPTRTPTVSGIWTGQPPITPRPSPTTPA